MLIGERVNTTLDNTGAIGPWPGGFQRSGLAGLFDMTGSSEVTDPATGARTFDPALITAINAEAVFVANLYRSLTGQAPLPPQATAPTVNVGLTAEAKNMLILAALGLGVYFFTRRRR